VKVGRRSGGELVVSENNKEHESVREVICTLKIFYQDPTGAMSVLRELQRKKIRVIFGGWFSQQFNTTAKRAPRLE
jgi:hypothetical protein